MASPSPESSVNSRLLAQFRNTLMVWMGDALNSAATIRQSPSLPLWVAVTIVSADFAAVWVSYRFAPSGTLAGAAFAGVLQYSVRLTLVALVVVWACKTFHVPGGVLGIRPPNFAPDFTWSLRICARVGFVIVAALALGCLVGGCLGWRAQPPPGWLVEAIGSRASSGQFITLALVGGAVLGLFAPVTEELIYRSVLLSTLTARIGLVPAVLVTAVIFSLLHVIPFGMFAIAVPQLVGGLVMAAGFSIRWSVVPAIVIHALGNLTVGGLVFVYVRLFEAFPGLFNQ